jgi:hypothetical protein
MGESTYSKIVKFGASLVRALDPNTNDVFDSSAVMDSVKNIITEVAEDIGHFFAATLPPKVESSVPTNEATPAVEPAVESTVEPAVEPTVESTVEPTVEPNTQSASRVADSPTGKVVHVGGTS